MKRVVLLGAGHAHLYVAARADDFVRKGHEVVLVSPDTFWYSGLATGVLGGRYPAALDRVDAGRIVTQRGGRHVRDVAVAIDAQAQQVRLRSGESLGYDALSINIGSETPVERLPGADRHGCTVKPICNLAHLHTELRAHHRDAALRLVIVGAGATGCEIAGNAQHAIGNAGIDADLTVLTPAERILPNLPPRAAAAVAHNLRRRGVRIMTGTGVRNIEKGMLTLTDGSTHPFDLAVIAIGLRPPALLRASGLDTDADGALAVDGFLRAPKTPTIFGAGDCIALEGHALPKIGVFAVRQSPVLHHNLLATLSGAPLRQFTPQKRWLLIMNLGDGTGLATWGGIHWHGRSAMWLKDRIDRRFLRRFQRAGGAVTPESGAGCVHMAPEQQ